MNQLLKGLLCAENELSPSPFLLGGNMAIAKSLFAQLPFDPAITRGEDGDYVMNCRLMGKTAYFDKKLGILHDPPPNPHRRHIPLAQDFQRFLLQRAKLEDAQSIPGLESLEAKDFDPYPGAFLREDLEERIVQTSTLLALDHIAGGNENLYQLTMEAMERAFTRVQSMERAMKHYLDCAALWRKGVAHLGHARLDVLTPCS